MVILDQVIKVVIYNFFFENHFEIIPSLLEFKPKFNVKHSWVNVLLNKHFELHVGLLPHVLLYLLLAIIVPVYLFYLRNNLPNKQKFIEVAIVFLMAGIFCALCGNVIWQKGVLDYIYLKPLFVFDLKDLYPDIALVLLLIYAFYNWSKINLLPASFKHVYTDTKNRIKLGRKF